MAFRHFARCLKPASCLHGQFSERTAAARLPRDQPLLQQTLCLLRGAGLSPSQHQGYCPGTQARPGYGQDAEEGVRACVARPRGTSRLAPCVFSGNLPFTAPMHALRIIRGMVSSGGPGGLDNYQAKTPGGISPPGTCLAQWLMRSYLVSGRSGKALAPSLPHARKPNQSSIASPTMGPTMI